MATHRICSIPDCGKPAVNVRGWCSAHYSRWLRHGDPLAGSPLRDGRPMRFYLDVVLPYEGDECLIWPFGKTAGYATLRIDGRKRIVSQVLCERLHGPSLGRDAAHSCGNGKHGCVTNGHLSWKTRASNNADKLVHGTHNRGERHYRSKFTEADVIEMRRLAATTPYREIGRRYGTSFKVVECIVNRRSWKWLA